MERPETKQVRRHFWENRKDCIHLQTGTAHNLDCKGDNHTQHLCYMVALGFHLSDEHYHQILTKGPRYKCQCCGRMAKSKKNLYQPLRL